MSNKIIPISQSLIGSEKVQVVDARTLYAWLGVETKFADWIKRRIEEYGFTQDVDYSTFLKFEKYSKNSELGTRTTEYLLSLDMAKELSMVERTARGKEARQYFIACEKHLREILSSKPAELPYHIRRYLANAQNVPKGHFAVLPELCIRLIFPLDRVGYHLPENMLPDISFGKLFCKHLRDDYDYNTDALPKYTHKYEDGRIVKPKCYPNELYAVAIRYLDDTWMPVNACNYFQARDVESLQFVSKAFGLLKYDGESER